MLSALLIGAVVALTVYGQLMIKWRALVHTSELADLQSRLHYLAAMLGDVGVLSAIAAAFLAALCWMLAMARLELGFAYPFMALTFVLVPIGSTLLFGEPLPKLQMLGLALIVAGVTTSALVR